MTAGYKVYTRYLVPNKYSRPQIKMKDIKGIVLHWVANAGSTAIANRNYFNSLRNQGRNGRYASAHEIIGINGEVVICIPSDEVAYHVGAKSYTSKIKQMGISNPNHYFYGIEVCHPDWTGKYSNKTYKTVVNRVVDLLIKFNLKPTQKTILRHYDITGKDCPRYYVKNIDKWYKLISDIKRVYKNKTERRGSMKLKKWQKDEGVKAIKNLVKQGIVNNPEIWEKTLDENVPQWLFWTIISRITK